MCASREGLNGLAFYSVRFSVHFSSFPSLSRPLFSFVLDTPPPGQLRSTTLTHQVCIQSWPHKDATKPCLRAYRSIARGDAAAHVAEKGYLSSEMESRRARTRRARCGKTFSDMEG